MDDKVQVKDEQSAGERALARAAAALWADHPWAGAVIYALKSSITDVISTAATDGRRLLVNGAWFASLPEDVRVTVLLHEYAHVVLKHGERRQDRPSSQWNVACDLAANSMLSNERIKYREQLESINALIPSAPLPELETAELYYDLTKQPEQPKSGEEQRGDDQGDGNSAGGKGDGDDQNEQDDKDENDPSSGDSKPEDEAGDEAGKDEDGEEGASGDEDKDGDAEGDGDDEQDDGKGGKENDKQRPKQALPDDDVLDSPSSSAVESTLQQAAVIAERGGKGDSIPKDIYSRVCPSETKQSYRQLLRNFLMERSHVTRTFERMPRRGWDFYRQTKLIPSYTGGHRLGKLLIAVDTSGSMNSVALGMALREIRQVLSEFPDTEIVLVEGDTYLRRKEKFVAKAKQLGKEHRWLGGGGTRYEFIADEAVKEQARGILVITDMGPSSWPTKWPAVPTLWLNTNRFDDKLPKNRKGVDFGKSVTIA